jgi:O-antigen biosynthesis protein WbqV
LSIETSLSKIGKLLDASIEKVKAAIKDLVASVPNILRWTSSGDENLSRKQTTGLRSSYAILAIDSFMAFLSIFISIHLRIGMDFLDYSPKYILKNMLVFGLVSSSVFVRMQTYQSFWRYTSIEDMPPIFLSVVFSNILFFPLMMLMNREDFLPYPILVINAFVLTLLLVLPRFLSRILYNRKLSTMKKIDGATGKHLQVRENPKILIVGRIASADTFLREIFLNDDIPFNFEPVGILTLDPLDVGRSIKGIPILGELREIGRVIRNLNRANAFPKQIVITEKSLPENAKKYLVKYVQDNGLLLMHVMHQCLFEPVSE